MKMPPCMNDVDPVSSRCRRQTAAPTISHGKSAGGTMFRDSDLDQTRADFSVCGSKETDGMKGYCVVSVTSLHGVVENRKEKPWRLPEVAAAVFSMSAVENRRRWCRMVTCRHGNGLFADSLRLRLQQEAGQRRQQHQCADHVDDEHEGQQDAHVSLELDR